MSTVTVITVSYRSVDVLAPFVDSIRAAATGPTPVVVVNNDVENHEAAYLFAGVELVTVLEAPRNLGYGAGMNLGAAGVDSDWILIANPDLVLHPGSLDELVRVGETEPDAGSVGPRVLTPAGEVYPSARRIPSLRSGVGHALFSRIWRRNPWTLRYLAERDGAPVQRDAGWLSGSCVLVRSTAFRAIGGFDEKFFMYFEDVDLGERLSLAGWRNVYAPSAVVTHEGAHSTSTSSRVMVHVHHESAYRYLASRYRAWYLWPLRLALRVGLAVRELAVRRSP